MEWANVQCSFYSNHFDVIGQPKRLRDVLMCDFVQDFPAIRELRKLDPEDPRYREHKTRLRSNMQGFTPAALLATREKGNVKVISYTNLMQLDFDYEGIKDYDIEELKAAVFDLPFIAFCGLSCSGNGFYALALISEPERLHDYAEHCFDVLNKYNVPCDTSKGKNPQDLRYVSYDGNMLIKDNPQPLRIKQFKPKRKPVIKSDASNYSVNKSGNLVLNKAVESIKSATVGNRWQTVQKWAYTVGGLNDESMLSEIKQAINESPEFTGQEAKYIKCAEDCFADGKNKPLS